MAQNASQAIDQAATAAWRADIMDIVRHYSDSRDGAPPPEIVEAVIYAESKGDPAAWEPGTGRIGLGQISPKSDAWTWYLEDKKLADTYGTDPNQVLIQPRANIEILTNELNRRQELGIAAAESGDVGALQDWYVTALAHRGYADNNGLTVKPDDYPSQDYYLNILGYVANQFGDERNIAIDEAYPGAIAHADGQMSFKPGKTTTRDESKTKLPSIPNPLGGWQDALKKLTGNAAQFGMRIGLFLVGLLLVVLALRMLFGGKS